MADRTVVPKKSADSNPKAKRVTSTLRKCAKSQTLTSPVKTNHLKKCQTPKSSSLFKLPDSPRFPRTVTKKCEIPLSPARKSISLTDLTPNSSDIETNTTKSTDISNKISGEINQNLSDSDTLKNDVKLADQKLFNAGRIVCNMLMINSWRHKKNEITQLQEIIDNLNQQVNQLQIQIIVLRRLLDTEKSRVGKLTNEVQQIKSQADDQSHKSEEMKKEKEKLESEVQKVKDMYENRLVIETNVRNDLDTARHQLKAMETQISREREKVLKLREDKKMLLEKISVSEKAAMENRLKVNETLNTIAELQLKLAAHLSLIALTEKETDEIMQELDKAKEEKGHLRVQLEACKENEKMSKIETINLKNKISDLDYALRRIESEYSLVLSEMNNLQITNNNNWSNRVLEIAGTIMRVPQAIFRSFSFL